MVAAFGGHTACVRILTGLEAGLQDESGITALMLAAANDHVDCVKILLEKEKKMEDKRGHRAMWYSKGESAKILSQYEDCACAGNLFSAVQNDCHVCCAKFLDQSGGTTCYAFNDVEC